MNVFVYDTYPSVSVSVSVPVSTIMTSLFSTPFTFFSCSLSLLQKNELGSWKKASNLVHQIWMMKLKSVCHCTSSSLAFLTFSASSKPSFSI